MAIHRVPSLSHSLWEALPSSSILTALVCLLVGGLFCPQAALGQSTLASKPVDGVRGEAPSANQEGSILSQQASVVPPVTEVPELGERVSVDLRRATLEEAINSITDQTDLKVAYLREEISGGQKVTLYEAEITAREALQKVLQGTNLRVVSATEMQLVLTKRVQSTEEETKTASPSVHESAKHVSTTQRLATFASHELQQGSIMGTVTDAQTGEPLPGVNVVVEGTQQGAATDAQGQYEITDVESGTYTLLATFVGYRNETVQDVTVRSGETTTVDIELTSSAVALEEVVAIGYGTQEAEDVTGSISRAEIDEVEANDVSVTQTLQGSIPGLSVGQVDEAGEDPNLLIRGRTSLSGEQDPLIVVDDVIYRGSIADLNPSDIESIDVLKDASATAVYGSQAANGVVVITTTKSGGSEGGDPVVNYSGSYAFQQAWRELEAQGPQAFMEKIEHSDLEQARTKESGYTERDPTWANTTNFKTGHEINAFNADQPFNWYNHVTAENPFTMKHNLSVGNSTERSNYYLSAGFTDQQGHIKDEGYTRFNARANLGSEVTSWLEVNLQSSMGISEFGPQMYSTSDRFIEPYAHPYEIGDEGSITDNLVQRPFGNPPNPLIEAQSDNDDKRLNLFGNIVLNIELPIEGLSYEGNLANNFRNSNNYFFGPHVANFQGGGSKTHNRFWDISSDQVISFNRIFGDAHDISSTLLYGLEKRTNNFTIASATNFAKERLGFNRLQDGDSDQQSVNTGGWEETSLYTMGRVNYVFSDKYMFTATLRRDGFSGFSDEFKWGYFPSFAAGWVVSEESFLNISWLDRLKIRTSYGTTGNRTIDRFETLAKVSVSTGYVTGGGSSLLNQNISDLASPSLQWEETTGINIGLDFDILNERIRGNINYYNKNTTNLLYQVDIPGMTGFEKFPDNLGKIHNNGLEMNISSTNVNSDNFQWTSEITFSRNRNEIKELLGFDIDGDGQEDDLVSEGLFIDEPLSAVYDYEIDGIWQPGEDIPEGYEFGSYKVVDQNGDGEITTDDRKIIGARSPSYRFGIQNRVSYDNWSLSFFVHSIQGGSDRYLGQDDLSGLQIFNTETHFNSAFPEGVDYWTPSNTDARYQRPGISGASGIAGSRYASRSFVRLKNLRLQYSFSPQRLQQFSVQSLNLYVSGRNLLTFTDWNGWDPETGAGINYGGRPVMKSYTLGLNITL